MARKVSLILSHWYHLFEGMQESSQRFYTLLQEAIDKRQIENLDISRVDYREGGIFSDKREYFRVRRQDHIFDVCAAPFGKGFFVSWWLGESLGPLWTILLMIPFLGLFLMRIFRPTTYYRYDSALMFQQSVHHSVLEVLDQLTKAVGVRALSEMERKPILSSFFKQ